MFKGKFGAFGLAAVVVMCVFWLAVPGSVSASDCATLTKENRTVCCDREWDSSSASCNNKGIQNIAIWAFEWWEDVTYLEINENNISVLSSWVFRWLWDDITLQLKYNSLEKIEEGAFLWSSIQQLHLQNNKLALRWNEFIWLEGSLQKIWLENCKLENLPKDLFKNMKKLDDIEMSTNRISVIPSGFFDTLTELSKLNLNNNRLAEINENTFKNNYKLIDLKLSKNQLFDLPSKIISWQQIWSLKLDATYNCLSKNNVDIISKLNLNSWKADNQRVCLTVDYDTPKSLWNVKHPVIARLALTWNAELVKKYKEGIDDINSKHTNQWEWMSGWRFVQNWSTDFDVDSLSGYAWYNDNEWIVNFPTSGKVTATVDWIIPNVVSFDLNSWDSATIESQNLFYDMKVTKPEAPTRKWYNFVNWFNSRINSGWDFSNNVISEATVDNDWDVKLVAQWTPNEYIITFKYWSGIFSGTEEQKVYSGLMEVIYDEPIKSGWKVLPEAYLTGYDFAGWYITWDDNKPIKLSGEYVYNVASGVDAIAVYEPHKFTISYDLSGWTLSEYTCNEWKCSQNVEYDQPLILPTPTRDWYDFSWWMDLDHGNEIIANDTFSWGYNIDTWLNLKADWTPHVYTMTFNYGDWTWTETSRQIKYSSWLGDLPEASRPWYTLSGWKVDEEPITWTGVYKWTENVTAKADWTANKYNIFIKSNSWEWIATPITEIIVTYNQAITWLPTSSDISRTWYTFDWIFDEDNMTGLESGLLYQIVWNSTWSIQWKPNQYPITLNANWGKVNDKDQDSITWTYNAEVKLPTPLYTWHNFQWWYSGDQKFETPFTYNLITGLNLVAKRELANYTLTFDTNWWTKINPITTWYWLEIPAITDPTRTWYVFTWWYDAKEWWDKISVPSKMPLNWQTIYAHWDANNYQLSFDFNWWTWDNTPIDVEFDKKIWDLPVATNTWFIFDGWKIWNTFINPWTKYTRPNSSTAIAQWSTPTAGWNNWWRSGGWSHRSNTITPTNYEWEVDANHGSAWNNDEDDEYHIAHQWAYEKWLTSFENFNDARMFEDLTRAEMAKISSIFATKFYDKVPDTSAEKSYACSQYADLADVNEELQWYIIQSCELGYMWYLSNWIDYLTNFRPNDKISRAEVAIVFSRIMWWNTYAWDENHWYEKHLQAMFDQWIIHNILTPFKDEMRWDVFIMLSRVDHVQ